MLLGARARSGGYYNLLIIILISFICLVPAKAMAQATYEGCYVGSGYPVASVPSTNVNDIAMATIFQGQPVIIYNPYVVSMVSPQTRKFFYYHECAHHVLGHTLGMAYPLYREQQADCWAIRALVGSGQFDESDIQAVQADLTAYAQGDWTHLPGTQRSINLYACLRN